eukprot:jgi/Undpi1/6618/HiC_scaffold_20.g09097.m1
MVPGRRSSSSKSTTATTTRPSDSLRLLFAAALLAILGSVRGEAENLRPEADLTSNCFGFPARNFVKNVNSVSALHGQSPFLLREPGEAAIDFTLHDTRGQAWNLREHLEGEGGKPVVLIWGMYTCPAYQGMGTDAPWDKCGYRDEFDLVESHKDRVTFVHLYGVEPHPMLPGTNFDSGGVVVNYWSTVAQPKTYEQRLAMVERIEGLTHPEQVILPDYLPGNPYSDLIQPVWCSYALGARPSIVISTDGTIWFQQTWLQTQDLAHHLDMLLKHLSPGSAGGSRVDESTVSGGGGPAVEEGQRKEHGGGQS